METTDGSTEFNVSKHLTDVNGRVYLEVRWRLVWFRREHPDGTISTELIEHQPGTYAVFKAEASYTAPDGSQARGIDYGSESAEDFRDYLEKASTKAVGRALALLGYGTAFALDLSEGVVVDAPVGGGYEPIGISRTRNARSAIEDNPAPATPKQIKFLYAIARDAGIGDDELDTQARELFGAPVDSLPRRDASALIERLQQGRKAPASSVAPSAPATAAPAASTARLLDITLPETPPATVDAFWRWARAEGLGSLSAIGELLGMPDDEVRATDKAELFAVIAQLVKDAQELSEAPR